MTRYQELTSAPTITPERSAVSLSVIAAAAIGTIVLIGGVGAAFAFNSRVAAPEATVAAQGETIDGWMAAVSAASRERSAAEASRTVDGWAARYLKPEPPVVDGWAAALLKPEPEVVDGWMTRYFVGDGD
jgi:hypothetical protein